MTRVALCLSGQFRTFDQCWPHILSNIVEPTGADVFVVMPDDDPRARAYADAYAWTRYEVRPDQIVDYPKQWETQAHYTVRNAIGEGKPVIQKTLQQWHGVADVIEMALEHCEYDFLIRCRTDIMIRNKLKLAKIKPHVFFTPNHDQCGGYNDRFSVGSWDVMQELIGLPWLIENYMAQSSNLFHGESYLKWFMEEGQVSHEEFFYPFHIVR
jgi:hypothetical protein